MAATKTLVKSMGLSGGGEIRVYDVSPGVGDTTGNITISDVTSAFVIGVIPMIEDSGANTQVAVQAKENSSTKNQIDYKLYDATNNAATSNLKDFRLTVKIED